MTGGVNWKNLINLEIRLGLELELKLEWFEGVSKTLGRLACFALQLEGGLRPRYKYGAKYTNLPRVFVTPSSHSNFNSNSNPNLNSKFTKFNEFTLPVIYPTFLWSRPDQTLVIGRPVTGSGVHKVNDDKWLNRACFWAFLRAIDALPLGS